VTKRLPIILLIVAGAAIAVYLFSRSPGKLPAGERSDPTEAAGTKNSDGPPAAPVASQPGSPNSSLPQATAAPPVPGAPTTHTAAPVAAFAIPASPGDLPTNLPPATVLENMRRTIRQFGDMFGGNPVGTNPEITRALAGDNPKHINFLKADGNRVNGQGELIDPWGTPYFFHQLSGSEMEVRSAGPDRRMYTSDDLVTK
jgi:hypothetical protein